MLVYWKLIKTPTWKEGWETYICDTEFCYGFNIDQSSPIIPNKFSKGKYKFEFHFNANFIPGNTVTTLKLYSDKEFKKEIYSLDIGLQSTHISHSPDPLMLNTTPSSGDTKLNIVFTNAYDTTYNVFWKVEKDASWKTAWETYICDLEFCYGSNVDQSAPILPNKFKKGNHIFEFHFTPNNVSGCTTVGLKLYSDKDFKQEIYSTYVNILNCSTGPDDIHLNTKPVAFPNPTHDFLRIKNDQNIVHIEIYDQIGRMVQTLKYETGQTIDVSSLRSGIYLAKLRGTVTTEPIIQKFVID
jgi:hypothetical protein